MKRLFLLSVALFLTAVASGQPKARIAQAPYTQHVTSDGFTVVWSTDNDAAAWVEIAPNDGTHFYGTERPKYYQSHLGRRHVGRLHAVRIDGLQPGTTYRYRVMNQPVTRDQEKCKYILGESDGSDVYRGKPYLATTLDVSKEQISFWVVNDIHARDSVLKVLLNGVEKANPDFVCLNGDMTSFMDSEEQLGKSYLSTISKISETTGIPFFFARGNHENRGIYASEFLNYFPTPTGESYYTFRQGPAFFLVLDGCEDKPDSDVSYLGLMASDPYREKEAAWLKEVVKSEAFRSAPVRIVLIHMPSGDSTGWHGDEEVRRLLVPTLNEAGVDLMICGHYHAYSYINDASRGTNFPILINSNKDKLVVNIDQKNIDAKVVDSTGKVVKEHKIDVRNK